MSSSRRFLRLLAVAALGCVPLLAGEYSKVSPGFTLDLGYATGNTSIPFQSSSGNIQGAAVQWVYGLSLNAPVRLGEVFNWRLRAFELVPTLSAHFGKTSDSSTTPNLQFYTPDGSVESVQNAGSSRKTNTQEVLFSLPLRWYAKGSDVYGGFYLEAGPVFAKTEQRVNYDVNGLSMAESVTLSESTTIRQNDEGLVYGIGVTNIYRNYQFTYGVTVRSMTSQHPVTSNLAQVSLGWNF
jgi:hypothetical protein